MPNEDPVAAIGHGMILLQAGGFARPTAELVRSAQQFYLTRLRNEASAQVRLDFDRHRVEVKDDIEVLGEFEFNSELVRWLIDRVKPADAFRLAAVNRFLATCLNGDGASPASALTPYKKPELMDPVKAQASSEAYGRQCKAAGVPLPPDWVKPGSAEASQWTRAGLLVPDFVSDSDRPGELYYFENADGICLALPRVRTNDKDNQYDDVVELLGVICQGNKTSKVCFWDNAEPFTHRLAPDSEEPGVVTIREGFLDANELARVESADMCTLCHRGENAFIVHPKNDNYADTPFESLEFKLRARSWVTPIVPSTWPQNRRPSRELDALVGDQPGGCIHCHNKVERRRLGQLDGSYCNIVRQTVLGPDYQYREEGDVLIAGTRPGTMPPTTTLSWQNDPHFSAIHEVCKHRRAAGLRDFVRFERPRPWVQGLTRGQLHVAGDFDDDGRADVARITDAGKIEVLLTRHSGGFAGLRDASFQRSDEVSTLDVVAKRIGSGDFNGNGSDDLVLLGDQGISVAMSNAAAFSVEDVKLPGSFKHFAVADFDNNGKEDLITVDTAGEVSLQLWDNWKFKSLPRRAVEVAEGQTLLAGDVNGDGFGDLVVVPATGGGDGTLYLGDLLDVGRFTSSSLRVEASAGATTRLADVDGDGLDDLVSIGPGALVRRSTGSTFVESANASSWLTGLDLSDAELADVDADSRADLIGFDADRASVLVGLSAPEL